MLPPLDSAAPTTPAPDNLCIYIFSTSSYERWTSLVDAVKSLCKFLLFLRKLCQTRWEGRGWWGCTLPCKLTIHWMQTAFCSRLHLNTQPINAKSAECVSSRRGCEVNSRQVWCCLPFEAVWREQLRCDVEPFSCPRVALLSSVVTNSSLAPQLLIDLFNKVFQKTTISARKATVTECDYGLS